MSQQQSFAVGQRVQSHPNTGLWLHGVRFGEIIKVFSDTCVVRFDRVPDKLIRMHKVNLQPALNRTERRISHE